MVDTDITFPVGSRVRINTPGKDNHNRVGEVTFTHDGFAGRCYHIRFGDSVSVTVMSEGELEHVAPSFSGNVSFAEEDVRAMSDWGSAVNLGDARGKIILSTSILEAEKKFGIAIGDGMDKGVAKPNKRRHRLKKQIVRALRTSDISSIQTFPLGTDWTKKQFADFLAEAMDCVR